MSDHFKGKSPIAHVFEARAKGKEALEETHGIELPGHYSAALDAGKETAIVFTLLWILLPDSPQLLLLIGAGWFLWKTGRSACLGWARLERLHRLIEEERWEIEHRRPQEREELKALYQAKGFSGQMLEEVIDVLMADDNRLLQVMLEEEMGLSLEVQEHPLKQAFGAGLGVALSFAFLIGSLALPGWGLPLTAALLIASSSYFAASFEKNRPLSAVVWNLAVASLACGVVYLLAR